MSHASPPETGVDECSERPPPLRSTVAEEIENSAWPAAKIQRALALSDADPIEQGSALRSELHRLSPQAVAFRRVAPECVYGSR